MENIGLCKMLFTTWLSPLHMYVTTHVLCSISQKEKLNQISLADADLVKLP